MEIIKTRVGDFVKEHLKNIMGYLDKHPEHISELTNIEYSKETFSLNSSQYPFMSHKNTFKNKEIFRCWINTPYHTGNDVYYFNSQWASKKQGEKRGKDVVEYLKSRNLLLDNYKDKDIKFIVGNTKTPTHDISTSQNSKPQKQPDIFDNISLNQILYGPPGTGKTYSTVNHALAILEATQERKNNINSISKLKQEFGSQVEFVTFHQSFGYEDFVEGLKAKTDAGKITYEIEGGVFKIICENCKNNSKPHILIIDEINRGNISRIFGELITLIEPSKRAGNPEEISVQLPYSKTQFSVPNNLYIIGTMNTADRSLTMMDTALRRRFDFIEMLPNADLITGEFDQIEVKKILTSINQRIEILYDREHTIGHAFLMNVNNLLELRQAFKNKILPLLEEYFYNDWQKICLVLNDDNNYFYKKQEESLGDFKKTVYHKQTIETVGVNAFIGIYAADE